MHWKSITSFSANLNVTEYIHDYLTCKKLSPLNNKQNHIKQPQKWDNCATGFVQTLKHCFPGLANSRVFQHWKTHFQGLSRIHSVHKHGCMKSKCAHTKSASDVTALQLNKTKCNICGCINVLQRTKMWQNAHNVLEPESKIFRTTTLEFEDFSRVFQDPCLFQDFPGREISTF